MMTEGVYPKMWKLSLMFFLALGLSFGQYKAEPAGAPAADIPAPIAAALQTDGHKIVGADGKALFEIWFRNELPKAAPNQEENVTFNTIPHGALLGVIKYEAPGSDRRGQGIKPGVYTLRYSMFPINGDHQGVAPQRDFLLLVPVAIDTDINATPTYKALTAESMKATGTPHPGVLSMWKAEADAKPGFEKEGENDWVLRTKIGDTLVGVILLGQFQG